MGKKKLVLIVSALAVTVILGCVATILLLNPKKEEEPNLYLPLISKNVQDVENINIQNQYCNYDIVKTGENSWAVPALQGADISAEYLKSALEYTAKFQADKLIATSFENGEKYGVGKIIATTTVTFTDGSSTAIQFFEQVADSTSYYFTIKGTTNIYSVSTLNPVKYFLSDKTSLISLSFSPFGNAESLDALDYVSLTNKNGSFVIENLNTNFSDGYANLYKYSVSGSYSGYLTGRFFYDKMPDLRDFSFSSAHSINPTKEQLTEFGLDNPQSELRLKSDSGDVTLLIGKGDSSGYYATTKDSPVVYRFVNSAVTWLDYSYEDICSPYLLAPQLSQVSQVNLTLPSGDYQFVISQDVVTCNGTKVDSGQFKNAYRLFCSTLREDPFEGDPPKAFDASISFKTSQGDKSVFFTVVGRKLAITIDSKTQYTCRKNMLDALELGVSNLLAGKNVSYQW